MPPTMVHTFIIIIPVHSSYRCHVHVHRTRARRSPAVQWVIKDQDVTAIKIGLVASGGMTRLA
jgi:hypothetical protein